MVPRTTLLLLVLVATGAGAAIGQEPVGQDSVGQEPATMRAHHQPPRFSFSVAGGSLGIGTLQRQPVTARRRDPAGAVLRSATLTRTVVAEAGIHAGAAVIASLSPAWALRLGVAGGRATLRTRYAGEDSLFLRTLEVVGDRETIELSLLSFEAALRFRIASTRRLQPYLELGAARQRWDAGPLPGGGALAAGGVSRTAVLAAVGAVIPVTGPLAARVQASTRVFRTPLEAAAPRTPDLSSSTLALSFLPTAQDGFASTAHSLVQGSRLEVGLSLGWGAVREAPRGRSGTDASTSPPTR